MKMQFKAIAFAAATLALGQAAWAGEAEAKKWIDSEFQPSTLSKDQQMAEMKWFIEAAKKLQAKGVKEISVVSETITTHEYESKTLAKAFEEITGIKVKHDLIQEGDVVEKLQTSMQSGKSIYDGWISDSDLIGTHYRYGKIMNLTDYMAGSGKEWTNPGIDIKDFIGTSFTTGPDKKLYQLPDQQFANLYWFRADLFARPDLKQKFKAKYGYELAPPQTWKQWDDQSEFFQGWGWDGSDKKLFGAGASYKPSGGGYSYYWWRQRFFAYGGQYFDAEMKPLVNTPAGIRALEEMVRTMPNYPPGVMLFESEEPKTMLVKGDVPMLYSWTSTGKRVGNAAESVIVGKAGFGIVPGAEIDGKIVHRPALTPGRGMAVSIYSQKKEATMKVLEFISNPEQSLKIVMDPKTIMDPWRISHFRSQKFQQAFPGASEYLAAIEKTFPHVVPDPIIPGANDYQRKLSFEITEALAKRKQPKEALDAAAAEWDKITDRRGRDKQKAQWGEKMGEMKQLGIEYHADWAAKAK